MARTAIFQKNRRELNAVRDDVCLLDEIDTFVAHFKKQKVYLLYSKTNQSFIFSKSNFFSYGKSFFARRVYNVDWSLSQYPTLLTIF